MRRGKRDGGAAIYRCISCFALKCFQSHRDSINISTQSNSQRTINVLQDLSIGRSRGLVLYPNYYVVRHTERKSAACTDSPTILTNTFASVLICYAGHSIGSGLEKYIHQMVKNSKHGLLEILDPWFQGNCSYRLSIEAYLTNCTSKAHFSYFSYCSNVL